MKHQAPTSKLQGNSNLRASKRRVARSYWSLVIGVWCFSGAWCLALGASEDGYGPPTSVPATSISRVSLPPRNWIDQTQTEADAKTIGCMQCHQGVEPMHKAS